MGWAKFPVQAWYRAVGEMQHMEEDRRRGSRKTARSDVTVIKPRS